MDEVHAFCVRVLGPGARAADAADDAHAQDAGGRAELLAAAVRACRARADQAQARAERDAAATLSGAVAQELCAANARLPDRHREALALREALRFSHAQIATAMGIDASAVAPLVARARLALRAERRRDAAAEAESACEQRDRSLRALALRQDSEPLSAEDDAWVHGHLATCVDCSRSHAAMLEATACYRAWRVTDPSPRDGGRPQALAVR